MMLQELLLPIFQDYGIYNFTLAAVKAGILHCAKSDSGEVAAFQSLFFSLLWKCALLLCGSDEYLLFRRPRASEGSFC